MGKRIEKFSDIVREGVTGLEGRGYYDCRKHRVYVQRKGEGICGSCVVGTGLLRFAGKDDRVRLPEYADCQQAAWVTETLEQISLKLERANRKFQTTLMVLLQDRPDGSPVYVPRRVLVEVAEYIETWPQVSPWTVRAAFQLRVRTLPNT